MTDDTPDTNGLGGRTVAEIKGHKSKKERLNDRLELDARRVEAGDIEDSLASEHARQVLQDDLEALYRNDLDFDNPPESITAFEQRVTLRNLMTVATEFGSPDHVTFEHREIIFEITEDVAQDLRDGSEGSSFADAIEATSEPVDGPRAKKAIDRMADYGPAAEQFLAMVAEEKDIHPEIAEYALDALGELQTQPAEHQSFVETLRRWWRGGRP